MTIDYLVTEWTQLRVSYYQQFVLALHNLKRPITVWNILAPVVGLVGSNPACIPGSSLVGHFIVLLSTDLPLHGVYIYIAQDT